MNDVKFTAYVGLFRQPRITLPTCSTLTGPTGVLAAIELAVENEVLDPSCVTEITITASEDDDELFPALGNKPDTWAEEHRAWCDKYHKHLGWRPGQIIRPCPPVDEVECDWCENKVPQDQGHYVGYDSSGKQDPDRVCLTCFEEHNKREERWK